MSFPWPAALPPFPIEADAGFDPNTIVTETDHGPRKKRRRYTAVTRRISVRNWHMKGDDLETILEFYENVTRGGAIAFTMVNPLNGMGTVTARFESAVRWQIVVPSDHDGTRWTRVEFDLEILP